MNISTPCIDVCKLDDQGVCQGCGRTAQQIAGWISMTEEQRLDIMAELRDRHPSLKKTSTK